MTCRLHQSVFAVLIGPIVALLSIGPISAQNGMEDPPAVYELDNRSVDWSPVKGLIVDVHRVIRVNKLSGAEAGRIRIWDTFFQRLTSFHGEVRDTSGQVLFSAGLPDVRSVAPFSEFRLYSGDVVRAIDLVAAQTPFIVEASWTVQIDNAFFWPDWAFEDSWPRERATYSVATPSDREVRYREAAPGLAHRVEERTRRRVTVWELNDWTPSDTDLAVVGAHPLLHVAPEEFRVGRLKGRTDSWNALGRWYWSLTKDQIKLRPEQHYQVERQVRDKVGDRVMAAALKDWISDQWRYVAIEVGLGGWRPNLAETVFDNRYGDCKDVTFLWLAMMRRIGLEAHPVLIRARNPLPIDPAFPKDWFDHVIAMTIINGDTLWADLSDPRYPLGFLPRACESRWGLVVGEFGGTLVETPGQPAVSNVLATHCEGMVDAEGNLTFQARLSASGHFARRLPLQMRNSPQLTAALILGVSVPSIEAALDSIDVVSSSAVCAQLHGVIRGWALAGPRQIVIRPRLAGWVANDTLGGRPDPGRVDFAQKSFDTLVVRLADGWIPEFWPEAAFVSETAGEFGEARGFKDNTLTVHRHIRWDAPGREQAEPRASARLRGAYRRASNAEWLFRQADPGGGSPGNLISNDGNPSTTPGGDIPGDVTDSIGEGTPRPQRRGDRNTP